MPAKLVVGFVVIALDGRLFEGSVHSLDLTICPWMVWFGQAMFDSVTPARAIKRMATQHCGLTFAVLRQIGKLDAVVGQHDIDLVGDGFDPLVEERNGCCGVGLFLSSGEVLGHDRATPRNREGFFEAAGMSAASQLFIRQRNPPRPCPGKHLAVHSLRRVRNGSAGAWSDEGQLSASRPVHVQRPTVAVNAVNSPAGTHGRKTV